MRDDLDVFQNEKVQVLAISTDPMQALKAYATAQGYEFPLLSDFWPHGEVARAYDTFNEPAGMANSRDVPDRRRRRDHLRGAQRAGRTPRPGRLEAGDRGAAG